MLWSDGANFAPRNLDFDWSNSGIQSDFPVVDDDALEFEYFEAFFDEELMFFFVVNRLISIIHIQKKVKLLPPPHLPAEGKCKGGMMLS